MNTYLKRFLLSVLLLMGFSNHIKSVENSGYENQNNDWLKIYYNFEGIKRINANLLSEIDSVEYKIENLKDEDSIIKNVHIVTKDKHIFILPVDSITSMVLGNNIPYLYIETNPKVNDIESKDYYIDAKITYSPYGDGTEALEQNVSIKGRGNTSWLFPKKPYRLKFDKKQTIGGLNKAKSFVLLSNYIDNTLMRNAVAMKIAELVNLPYTNKILPVNLVFNGQQRGNYMLTNKVGINSGSIDIDENEGILWEFDVTFDEEFKFHSENFSLPCMVKDPDFHEITDDSEEAIEEIWNFWKKDLEDAFQKVADGNWRDAFDEEQFIKYFIVQDLVLNTELEFPKSFYAYKENKNGKYKLGPCWDYDWSFGYHHDVNRGVIHKGCGSFAFLGKILEDPEFVNSFRLTFNKFCDEHLDDIMNFIDDYAELIRDSALADALIWPAEHYNTDYEHAERNTNHFDDNVKELKDWILKRIEVINLSPVCGLY